MIDILVPALIGAIFGVGSSLIAWWVVTRLIVPKITFSPEISHMHFEMPYELESYRVKLFNAGRRAAIDITLHFQLRTPSKTTIENTQLIDLGTRYIPFLGRKHGRTCRIRVNSIPRSQLPFFSDAVRERIEQGCTPSLNELMSDLGEGTVCKIWALCYDEYSGSRRMFASPEYSHEDISPFQFAPDSSKMLKTARRRYGGGPR